jgi:hypothetical protein
MHCHTGFCHNEFATLSMFLTLAPAGIAWLRGKLRNRT